MKMIVYISKINLLVGTYNYDLFNINQRKKLEQ